MSESNNSENKRDPFDGPYVGNIWGKRMTLYGGIFILLMLAIVLYRHWAMDVPFGMDEQQPTVEQPYYQQKAAEEKAARDSANLEE